MGSDMILARLLAERDPGILSQVLVVGRSAHKLLPQGPRRHLLRGFGGLVAATPRRRRGTAAAAAGLLLSSHHHMHHPDC